MCASHADAKSVGIASRQMPERQRPVVILQSPFRSTRAIVSFGSSKHEKARRWIKLCRFFSPANGFIKSAQITEDHSLAIWEHPVVGKELGPGGIVRQRAFEATLAVVEEPALAVSTGVGIADHFHDSGEVCFCLASPLQAHRATSYFQRALQRD